jgi:outer membrane lipoprotein-sorting protein
MKLSSIVIALILCVVGAGVPGAQHQDKYHHKKSSPRVNYDSLSAAATPLEKSTGGKALVENCIAAYGGLEKLQSLDSFELTYESTSRFGGEPYKLVKAFQRGRRYKISRLSEERILNGKDCWFRNEETTMDLDSGRYRAELYSYLTLAMPLAIRTEEFDAVKYGEIPDDPLAYIYLDKLDSLMVVVGIDRKDYKIRSVAGVIRQGDEKYVFVNHFSDFEQHDGFQFPGRVRTVSMGLEVSTAQLKSVRVNPDFSDKDFRP